MNVWSHQSATDFTRKESDSVLEKLYQIEEAFRHKQAQLEQYKDIKFSITETGHSLSCTINLLASEKEMSFWYSPFGDAEF